MRKVLLKADNLSKSFSSGGVLQHVLDTLTAFHDQGQSVVMVTHDIRSARRGNRILYLKDGVILGECDLGKYVHGDRERHGRLSDFLTEMGW